ncbi:MAG TPA: regulatory protein GemA [Syntrophorhabdaceae bacterium]|nr:regulatory protein GemA [Syntrophorhabdaceae bacterium]HQM82854.1 regulatory protein GemA [Syntrophorhabdaceae bacterium]
MDISKDQIRRIHTIIHALEMPDCDYRAFLDKWFGVTTCKKLTYREADVVIKRLEYIATKMGRWQPREGNKQKYDELGNRPGMAKPKQLRMIEAMWCDVSYQPDHEAKIKALNRFIFGFFRISHIRFLEDWQAKKIIRALQEMKEHPAKQRRYASCG